MIKKFHILSHKIKEEIITVVVAVNYGSSKLKFDVRMRGDEILDISTSNKKYYKETIPEKRKHHNQLIKEYITQ